MKFLLTFIIFILFTLGSLNLYAQKEGEDLIDSLQTEVGKKRSENSKAMLYENIGTEYNYLKNYKAAKENYTEALDIYNKQDNEKGAARMTEMNKQMDRSMAGDPAKVVIEWGVVALIVVMIVVIILLVLDRKKKKATNALLSAEKKKSEDLLRNILPAKIAKELRDKGMSFAQQFDPVTVIITDFVSFTKVAERFSPTQLVGELHACFKAFDEVLDKYNVEKIKTVGDAYLAVSGLPEPNKNHAVDAVSFAIYMRDYMLRRKVQLGDATFQMRIGIHTGSVIAGLVGTRKYAYDIWGDTVNVAARMEQNGEPGRINVSHTTYELIKDKFHCIYRGEIDAKNKGRLEMYFVE